MITKMNRECLSKYFEPYFNETQIGIDEAGRGSLLGPVFVGAVIWNNDIEHPNINYIKDSKKLSKKKRNEMRAFIENNALAWSVASCDNTIIDDINILNATYKAMHDALEKVYINNKFNRILVDGNGFLPFIINNETINHNCIIKGDNKYLQIAAASILAKTHHDEYIEQLCNDNENLKQYGLMTNFGYGTKQHREAISKYGITEYHRKSFKIKSLS